MTTSAAMRAMLLAKLRCLRIEMAQAVADVDIVGVQLKTNIISPEEAMHALHAMGLLESINFERREAHERKAA